MAEKTISLNVKNQRVKEELKEVISSMNGFRIQNSGVVEGCDLLILEIGEDLKKEFELIHSLQESSSVSEIFLTSSHTEPEILIRALRAGAKEFFTHPIIREEVKNALLNFSERSNNGKTNPKKVKQGKIINVIGSKGGVGTTTVAVNLAASLNELNNVQSVAIIDMNLLFGEIPLFLDIVPNFNWGEVAQNISRLDSTYLMSVLSIHTSGVYVLPSPTQLDGVNVATPEIIEKLLELMKKEFDFIVIDSGQSLDDISLKITELSDTVLLVSTLSLPCLINVKRLMETFWGLGYSLDEKIKIIMNRYHKKSVISLKEAEEGMNQKIFWLIPNDYSSTVSAINQGKVLSNVAQGAEISKNFKELSCKFSENNERKNEKRGFLGLKFMGRKA